MLPDPPQLHRVHARTARGFPAGKTWPPFVELERGGLRRLVPRKGEGRPSWVDEEEVEDALLERKDYVDVKTVDEVKESKRRGRPAPRRGRTRPLLSLSRRPSRCAHTARACRAGSSMARLQAASPAPAGADEATLAQPSFLADVLLAGSLVRPC